MKITLRERKKGDRIVLYLDYYQKGFRRTEYLDIYLIPSPEKGRLPRNDVEKNKDSKRLAEQICHQKNIDFNSGKYSISDIKKQKALIIPYFELIADNRNSSIGNSGNWKSMVKHLKNYCHPGLTFENLNTDFVEGFKTHLSKVVKSNDKPLAQNSRISYFNKLQAGLTQANKDGLLIKNPGDTVSGFKNIESQREYLTVEEIEKLVMTECELPILKKAFLFSCLTGLRFGDLKKLQWSDVSESDSTGPIIKFRQSKTKSPERLPISDQAISLLGDRNTYGGSVFPHLQYSAWNNVKLSNWVKDSGIDRKITFHAARHTHAVLQLSLGTDIYTVSKLLGHKSLKTTQVYAKVIDESKRKAVNRLSIKNLDIFPNGES